jgi:type IV pilus assembly protein PilX
MNSLSVRQFHGLPAKATRESGFVLVTGLIFLVLMTLLAVSSTGTSVLQEKMGSSFRERAQAGDAAEATLRDAEFHIGAQTTMPVPTQSTADAFMPAGDPVGKIDNIKGFLDPGTWATGKGRPAALQSRAYGSDTGAADLANRKGLPAPRYFIEDFAFRGYSMNPDDLARGVGDNMYRVTGRAEGGNPNATVTLQSLYMKRFN